MKAIIWTRYGAPDVLELREVGKPTPKDNEVLISIHATTVTAGDCEMRSLKLPIYFSLPLRIWLGFRKPKGTKIFGTEFAGEIEAAGKDVILFTEGDQVFGSAGLKLGANAEYICLSENAGEAEGSLAIKPTNMTYEEAAAVPLGGREALHFLRQANIQRGQKILVIGAGGSIGTFAVQLARHYGAEVTAVDHTTKLDILHSIGADQVIDYTQADFTKNGVTYDVIFDVAGKLSLSRSKASLKKNGTYLLGNPGPSQYLQGLWMRMTSSQKVVLQPSSGTAEDLIFIKGLIEAGEIKTVIDRYYPLEQIAEAHRYVETGQKKGNVVITVRQNLKT
jgi:NADPH:quinone reductase-like Zn-dependent oxidoreductase